MKIILKKILQRVIVAFLFCMVLLLFFAFNPFLLYAKETSYKNFTIYHNNTLNRNLTELLDESLSKLKSSEIYNEGIKIRLCLNDGSLYPDLIQTLMGQDVIRSFSTISVVHASTLDIHNNTMIFNQWNDESFKASQMFIHSFTHCLQYKKYGFWGSNPIAMHDEWKWEGYAEYTSFGRNYDLNALLKKHFEPSNLYWIELKDGFKTSKNHLKYLMMVKYSIEILHMSYDQILKSKNPENEVYIELINWHKNLRQE